MKEEEKRRRGEEDNLQVLKPAFCGQNHHQLVEMSLREKERKKEPLWETATGQTERRQYKLCGLLLCPSHSQTGRARGGRRNPLGVAVVKEVPRTPQREGVQFRPAKCLTSLLSGNS